MEHIKCSYTYLRKLRGCVTVASEMYAHNTIYSGLSVSQNEPLLQLKQLSREEQRVGYYLATNLDTTLEEEMYLSMEEM